MKDELMEILQGKTPGAFCKYEPACGQETDFVELHAQITRYISEQIIGEDEPETWFNKELAVTGGDYERRFLVDEVPKRIRNALRAEQRKRLEGEA